MTNLTVYFTPNNFTNNDKVILNYFSSEINVYIKMVEAPANYQEQFNNGKTNIYPQWDNVMQFRLDKINKTILMLKLAKEKQKVKHSVNILKPSVTLIRLY